MIFSAYVLPLPPSLPWATAVAPGPNLTRVDGSAPVDVLAYAARDRELAYRDLVVAAALSRCCLQAADAWQFMPQSPRIPATVGTDLAASTADLPLGGQVGSAGRTTFVNATSTAIAACGTDSDLYARDILAWEALYRASRALEASDMVSLASYLPGQDAWAIADGVNKFLDEVALSLPLDVTLFHTPDSGLAQRDNVVASYVSHFAAQVQSLFERAERLYMRVPGAEPELYVLADNTSTERTWKSLPLLPGRGYVRYDKTLRALAWVGEAATASSATPAAWLIPGTVNPNGGDLSVVGAPPAVPDVAVLRQKASRLPTRPYRDRVIFGTLNPELFILSGGLYQLDAALATVPGTMLLSLPIGVPSGCVRVALLVSLGRRIAVLGFTNQERVVSGTAAPIAPDGTATYKVTLAAGRYYMSLTYTSPDAAAATFPLVITANNDLVFDGSVTFNATPGVAVTSQGFEVDAVGGDVYIAITRGGGVRGFTLLSFALDGVAPLPARSLAYSISVQVGADPPSPLLQVAAVPDRMDVLFFDLQLSGAYNPPLGITWSGGDGASLYVLAYDIRVFDQIPQLPDAQSFEPHVAALAGRTLGLCRAAYAKASTTGQLTDQRVANSLGELTWTPGAQHAWTEAIRLNGEPRLYLALNPAGPGDVGRPALMPAGLQLASNGIDVIATRAPALAVPVFCALQPWMVELKPLVLPAELWPPATPACARDATPAVGVDFSFTYAALCPPEAFSPYVDALSVVSRLTGQPPGASFEAYTLTNTGPGGGTLQQTVDYAVTLRNLAVGATYTLTITYASSLADGSGATTVVEAGPITASDATQVEVGTVTADLGYRKRILSVKIT